MAACMYVSVALAIGASFQSSKLTQAKNSAVYIIMSGPSNITCILPLSTAAETVTIPLRNGGSTLTGEHEWLI